MNDLFLDPEKLLGSEARERERQPILSVLSEAVAGADAYGAVKQAVKLEDDQVRIGNRFLTLGKIKEVAFIAAGNAAAPMASALVDTLGDVVTQGLLIAPEDPPRDVPFQQRKVFEPFFPSEEGAAATAEALELVAGLGKSDLLVPLLSPGALGMLSSPPPSLGFSEYLSIFKEASSSGIPPAGLLAIARGLSPAMGGGLANAAHCQAIEALVIDRGEGSYAIGAGPVSPPPADNPSVARNALEQVGWWNKLPASARDEVLKTKSTRLPSGEFPRTVTIAGPAEALEAAGYEASDKKHYPTLQALSDNAPGPQVVQRLVDAIEKTEGGQPPGRFRGRAVFTATTFGLPEGCERDETVISFLSAAKSRLKRRDVTIGVLYTAGSMYRKSKLSCGLVDATSDPATSGVRGGFTDVGCIAVGWRTIA